MPFNTQQFNNLDETRPVGSQYVSVIDDFERQTRGYIKYCFNILSGYPDNSCIRIVSWDTAGRPTGGLKEGIVGYNTDTKRLEWINNGAWSNIYLRVDNAITVGDEASGNNIDITTGATANRPTTGLRPLKTMYYDTDQRMWFCYYADGWKANSGCFAI